VSDYTFADGFASLNTLSTVGSFLLGVSTLAFLWNLWRTQRTPRTDVGDDSWGFGSSLEWATSSPPPHHNFTRVPRIRSHRPAYDLHHGASRPRSIE
jgi:cytochrome c oxidase subunit 1